MKRLLALGLLIGCDGSLETDPPDPPPTNVRLLSGPVELLGGGLSTCSHEPAQPGRPRDRWCAFDRAGQDGIGAELWVIDVTQAARARVPCDGTSPYCLRLTTNLWTDQPVFSPSHPGIHAFTGDTLVFHADAAPHKVDDPYRGPIRAWRPGWPSARIISTSKGVACLGHLTTAAALCIDDLRDIGGVTELDLMAGTLADPAGGPLPMIQLVKAYSPAGHLMWRVTFSPAGDYLAFSSPADGEDVEVLRGVKTSDLGARPPTELLRGASQWAIANDDRKVYFLRDFDFEGMNGSTGALTIADFPSGAGPSVLHPQVADYLVLGSGDTDRGIAFVKDVVNDAGTLMILGDRSRPEGAVKIDEQVEGYDVSPDLRYSFYTKFDDVEGGFGTIANNDGSGTCVISAKKGHPPYGTRFMKESRRVLWAEDSDSEPVTSEGWFGDPRSCGGKTRFSSSLAYLDAAGGGVIFGETDTPPGTMMLKYATITGDLLSPEGGETLGRHVDGTVTIVDDRYALYTINQGAPEDQGLYLYGPFPR